MLRKEALANNLAYLNPNAFWSEIKNIIKCKTSLPTSIEGVSGGAQIVECWRIHLSKLLNCVTNSSVHTCEFARDEKRVVSVGYVTHTIEKLDIHKALGQMVFALNM